MRQAREALGLGSEAVPDIFHLLEDEGLLVLRRPLGDDGPEGALFVADDLQVVLVNCSKRLSRQHFTAAHEYGHFLFDAGTRLTIDVELFGSGSQSIPEKRANAFAAHFLMPESGVRRFLSRFGDEPIGPPVAVHMQRHFGVSYESALRQLRNMRLISPAQFESLRRVSPERLAWELGYGEQLSEEETQREASSWPTEYVMLSIRVYQSGSIALSRLAELLGESSDEAILRRRLDGAGIHPPGADC